MINIFQKLFSEYPKAKEEEFASHLLADYVRNFIPQQMVSTFPEYQALLWDASPGKGRWADAPWIALFDPLITETAQEGFYPVYLFDRNIGCVYLSLNQGMTSIKEEVGNVGAKEIMQYRAKLGQKRLNNEYLPQFSNASIDLQPARKHDRLAMYEAGHIIGKRYEKNNLPSNQILLSDFRKMVSLYQSLIVLGGLDDLDELNKISEQPSNYSVDLPLEEKRKMRLHRRIERNKTLIERVKDHHGYTCQVCGFNFFEVFGEIGKDYIEAHHLIPISQLPKDKPAFLSPEKDFAIVCANCHRMIHRPGAPPSFDDFVKLYSDRQ